MHDLCSLVRENKFQVISVMRSDQYWNLCTEEEGGFSAQFSGIFIFIIDSYYRDLSCSRSVIKSFVI